MIRDAIPKPIGIFSLYRQEGNKRELFFRDKNLILDAYSYILSSLLLDGSVAQVPQILKIGNTGHFPGDLLVPRVPGIGTYQTSRTLMFAEDALEDPTPNPVRFVYQTNYNPTNWSRQFIIDGGRVKGVKWIVTIDYAEANDGGTAIGQGNYTEAAICSSDRIFSLKTYPVFIKTSGVRMIIEWEIWVA